MTKHDLTIWVVDPTDSRDQTLATLRRNMQDTIRVEIDPSDAAGVLMHQHAKGQPMPDAIIYVLASEGQNILKRWETFVDLVTNKTATVLVADTNFPGHGAHELVVKDEHYEMKLIPSLKKALETAALIRVGFTPDPPGGRGVS